MQQARGPRVSPNATRLCRYDPGGLTDPASHYSDYQIYAVNFLASGVPESSTWAMMLIGFGLVGLRLRRRMQVISGMRGGCHVLPAPGCWEIPECRDHYRRRSTCALYRDV